MGRSVGSNQSEILSMINQEIHGWKEKDIRGVRGIESDASAS
jgi:hypothetical protein